MKLYCRGSKECKQCSFCTITNVLMVKLNVQIFFFSAVVQQCVFASTCLSRQAREIQGFCVAVFPDKQHLQPLQSRSFMLAHLRRVPVCVSSLYSFVSVRQSDCLTITALIKLSGDEKSSLQSVQKQANRCEFKHMSIRDAITVPLAEVGNVTVDSIRMNKSTFTNTHKGLNTFTCMKETNVGVSEVLMYFTISFWTAIVGKCMRWVVITANSPI